MAQRVGTGATATADAAAATLGVTKSMTAGNTGYMFLKFETATSVTGVVDSFGSVWAVDTTKSNGSTGVAVVCKNILGTGSNTVTATFNVNADFRRGFLEEISGIDKGTAVDVTSTTGTGSTSPYSAPALTTTRPGIAFFGVADFAGLSSITATGTPTHTIANTLSDCFLCFYLSSAAQSITGGATAAGTSSWASIETALRDAQAGTPPAQFTGLPFQRLWSW